MLKIGLTSVSFRNLTPLEIIELSRSVGINRIEWGSDVHAPQADRARLFELATLQKRHGVTCTSYGTYFKLGVHLPEEMTPYFDAAEILGTKLLRIWAGNKASVNYTAEEKKHIVADAVCVASMAKARGMTVALECHPKTLTDRLSSAWELMTKVASPNFLMYWQPNQFYTFEENVNYVREIAPYVTTVHAFYREGKERLPLSMAIDRWKTYLSYLTGNHDVLLEFMPDDRPESLLAETEALRRICQ